MVRARCAMRRAGRATEAASRGGVVGAQLQTSAASGLVLVPVIVIVIVIVLAAVLLPLLALLLQRLARGWSGCRGSAGR